MTARMGICSTSRWKSQLYKKIYVKYPTIPAEFLKQIRSIAPIIPTLPHRELVGLTTDGCIHIVLAEGGSRTLGYTWSTYRCTSYVTVPCMQLQTRSCCIDCFIARTVPGPVEAEIGFQFNRPLLSDRPLPEIAVTLCHSSLHSTGNMVH